jgi:hypothetical protein
LEKELLTKLQEASDSANCKIMESKATLAKKTTPMPLNYQILSLAKVALLSMASQRMIIVVSQSPAQVMSTAMEAITIHITCTGD